MFIHCTQGHVTDDRCGKTPDCPQSCPERAERIAARVEALRSHQRALIDRYGAEPTAVYYEMVGALQERIEAVGAEV